MSDCFFSPGAFLYIALIRHLKVVRTLALSNLYLWKKQITSEMVQMYCYTYRTLRDAQKRLALVVADVLTLF